MSILKKKVKIKPSDFSKVLVYVIQKKANSLVDDKNFINDLDFKEINQNKLYLELIVILSFFVTDVFSRSRYDEVVKTAILDDIHQQLYNNITLNNEEKFKAFIRELFDVRYEEYHECFSENENWIREFSKLCIENICDHAPDGEIEIQYMSIYIASEYIYLPDLFSSYKLIL